jgi:lipoprotein-releasing system ATP-binding protein
MNPIVKATHICKRFTYPVEVEVLKDISLEIFPEQTVAIVGKSGEGKTTLLNILATLDNPSSGIVEICGHKADPYKNASLRNDYIGFVFQAYHLLEDSTVLENVLLPAKIKGFKTILSSPSYQRALMLLDEVGVLHRASFPVKLLSGGEKQKVAIARSLMNDPPVIFADEPSGNLDQLNSEAIYQILFNLSSNQGKAIVIVTHDLELAKRCQKTYTLQAGQLILKRADGERK